MSEKLIFKTINQNNMLSFKPEDLKIGIEEFLNILKEKMQVLYFKSKTKVRSLLVNRQEYISFFKEKESMNYLRKEKIESLYTNSTTT